MSRGELNIDDLRTRIRTALASEGNASGCRSLCVVIETLAARNDRNLSDKLGKDFSTGLLRLFLSSAHNTLLRRWSGLLLSELCKHSQRTASLLGRPGPAASHELKGLGRLVLEHEEKEDLKFVSCTIMKQLHSQKVNQELFWPSQAPPVTFAVDDSQEWLSHLQDILDNLTMPQSSSTSVLYPGTIEAPKGWYYDNHDARIAALLEDQLTIIIPPPAITHIVIVDVPFESMQEVVLAPDLTVILKLRPSFGSYTYTVNATPSYTEEIILKFGDEGEAKDAALIIRRRCGEGLRSSQQRSLQVMRSSSITGPPFNGGNDSGNMEQAPSTPPHGTASTTSKDREEGTKLGVRSKRLAAKRRQTGPPKSMATTEQARQDNEFTVSHFELPPKKRVLSTSHSVRKGENVPDQVNSDSNNNEETDRISNQPWKKHTGPLGKNASIYDVPEESSGPSIPPDEPRKTKAREDRTVAKPERNLRQIEAPQTRSKQLRRHKRKDQGPEHGADEEYLPSHQQEPRSKAPSRLTRATAAAARQSDSESPNRHARKENTAAQHSSNEEPRNLVLPGEPEEDVQNDEKVLRKHVLPAKPNVRKTTVSVRGKTDDTKHKKENQCSDGNFGSFLDIQEKEDPNNALAPKENSKFVNNKSISHAEESSRIGDTQDEAIVLSSAEEPDPSSASDSGQHKLRKQYDKAKMGYSKGNDGRAKDPAVKSTAGSATKLTSSKPTNRGNRSDTHNSKDKEPPAAAVPGKGQQKVNKHAKSGKLSISRVRLVSEGGVAIKNRNLDEKISKDPQIASSGPVGPQSQGRCPAQSTPRPATPFQTTYSSGRPRMRREADTFSTLIDGEEAIPTSNQSKQPLLPRKRSPAADLPHGREKRRPISLRAGEEKQRDDQAEPSGQVLMDEDEGPDGSTPEEPSSPSTASLAAQFDDEAVPIGIISSPHPRKNEVQLSPQTTAVEPALGTDTYNGLTPAAQSQSQSRHIVEPSCISPTLEARIMSTTAKLPMENTFWPGAQPPDDKARAGSGLSPRTVLHREQHYLSNGAASDVQRAVIADKDAESTMVQSLDSPGIPRAYRLKEARAKSVLSSNRKIAPGPPEEDSKAITARVPQNLLNESKSLQTPAPPPTDPFNKATSSSIQSKGETYFMRKLRKEIEKTKRLSCVEPKTVMFDQEGQVDGEDVDRTLVEMIDEAMDVLTESTGDGSTTDESSTMYEESEEILEAKEWEASLKPHQRGMFEVLARISRHFVRHMIDSETAIEDIITDYDRDGLRLIEQMEEYHLKEYETQRRTAMESRTRIASAFIRVNEDISSHEKQVRTWLLSKNWGKDSAISKKQISRMEGLLDQMSGP